MPFKHYDALAQDENLTEEGGTNHQVKGKAWQKAIVPVLASALLISFVLNLLSYSKLLAVSSLKKSATEFAGLTFNTEHIIEYRSRYNDPDRSVEEAAWASDLINPTTLVVALDDSFTESQGVQHSMRWPWDSNKGVYTLTSSHQLHCLHLLRSTVNEAHDGLPLVWPRAHTAHCLEYLLQNIMCYADDTPLYQGLLNRNRHAEHPMGGLGDTRKCRDWNQLHSWAQQHSACYNKTHRPDDPTFPEKERYKFCPDNRKPWEGIQS